jgi:cupin 2 domain-containing protein
MDDWIVDYISELPQPMPLFTCPRCGKDYLVPLALCEAFLDTTPMQTREGSEPVYVLPCQECEAQTLNLLSQLPSKLPTELVETVVKSKHVRIERIVSTGHASPKGFWYDQDEAEWVVVLRGEAKLLFEGEPQPVHLKPGDHATIPAHERHRVEWTTPKEPTVWLAVFYGD